MYIPEDKILTKGLATLKKKVSVLLLKLDKVLDLAKVTMIGKHNAK